MDYATFFSTYADGSGTFQDNTTRNIEEGDLRQFANDILNTFNISASAVNLDSQSIEIGSFNIPSLLSKEVYVGSSSIFSTIKYFGVEVVNDLGTAKTTAPYYALSGDTLGSPTLGSISYISGASSIVFVTCLGTGFRSGAASANYDSTSINRGYVTLFF